MSASADVAIGSPKSEPRGEGLFTIPASIGRAVQSMLAGIGSTARFLGETIGAIRVVRSWWPETRVQALRLGVASLPIALLIAMFTGVVLALLASYSFTGAVPLYFVGTLVEKTITLELAPVLTGLALAGRVGANIAAELGTMRVTEQVDALETLCYDPLSYLVVPRVIAAAAMFPVIVAASIVVGIFSAWASSVALLHLSTSEFAKGLRLFFDTFDVEYGVVKSASFGLTVSLIGCRRGLRASGGAVGVGRAATSAVVYSAVLILVLDALWAVTWLLGREPMK